VTVRQRVRLRRGGLLLASICTILGAIVALFAWNGGNGESGTLAQASTGELLGLVGLFVVPPLTFAIMGAEQHFAGRKKATEACTTG